MNVQRLAEVFEQQRAAFVAVPVAAPHVEAKARMLVAVPVVVRKQARPAQPVTGAPVALLDQPLGHGVEQSRIEGMHWFVLVWLLNAVGEVLVAVRYDKLLVG